MKFGKYHLIATCLKYFICSWILFASVANIAKAQMIKGYIPDYGKSPYIDNINYSNLTDALYLINFNISKGIYVDANDNIVLSDNSLFKTIQANCVNKKVNLYLSIQDAADPITNLPQANFSKMASNTQLRKNFVSQCAEFCANNGLKGIDLDWETPEINEAPIFTELLYELRLALIFRGC